MKQVAIMFHIQEILRSNLGPGLLSGYEFIVFLSPYGQMAKQYIRAFGLIQFYIYCSAHHNIL